jgi:protein-tyrosine kinase
MNALLRPRPSPFGVLRLAGADLAPETIPPVATETSARHSIWDRVPALDLERAIAANSRLGAARPGLAAMPFDALRTKLTALSVANGWKTVAVTSANAGAGKTTVVANLALAFARSGGKRVLVLDMNQKRPGLAAQFAVNPRQDIEPLLSGEVDLATQAWRVKSDVVLACAQVRTSGVLSRWDPHQIGESVARLAAEVEADLVICDLPVFDSRDSTFGFLAQCDVAIAVARQDHCRLSDLDRCERLVASQTNFAGFVVNRA